MRHNRLLSIELLYQSHYIFLVRAPQPSDVRRNERSQVSKGKFDVNDDVTVKSKFCQRVSQLVPVYTHMRRDPEKSKLTTTDSIVHVEGE